MATRQQLEAMGLAEEIIAKIEAQGGIDPEPEPPKPSPFFATGSGWGKYAPGGFITSDIIPAEKISITPISNIWHLGSANGDVLRVGKQTGANVFFPPSGIKAEGQYQQAVAIVNPVTLEKHEFSGVVVMPHDALTVTCGGTQWAF